MKIEVPHQCAACNGTGLYKGMAERGSVAVVCSRCKGTGRCVLEDVNAEFTGRKESIGVSRVVKANPGICISDEIDIGGMDYVSWVAGNPFPDKSEMREYTCPRWWYQSADYSKAPKWGSCDESLGVTFSRCPNFKDKAACWDRFDRESDND